LKTFRQFIESFDAAEFRAKMSALKSREELRKSNPVGAKALDLADKEKQKAMSTKKTSDVDARSWDQDQPSRQDVNRQYYPRRDE